MVPDHYVAAHERHITVLAFAGVDERIGVEPVISIALLLPAPAREQQDDGLGPWRADAALTLPPY